MSQFAERLDEELSKFDQSVIKCSIHAFHRKLGKPLLTEGKHEGIYYWVPQKDGSWKMLAFQFDLYGTVTHEDVWNRYIVHEIAKEFGADPKQLEYLYGALPRGRVFQKDKNIYALGHGDDSPGPISRAASEFGLNEADKIGYWSHETMVLDDYVALCKAINKDLGLKPIPEDTRWDRPDEI